jgi:hypothetical protein
MINVRDTEILRFDKTEGKLYTQTVKYLMA